ncbi:UNVERIFIED_CONTAM: Growth-regulating factor 4 [Sesamum latifolium]|uniref:Growth-regulating factor n=1 Tax=Sesamum latifolium TaxID=2727402 RepID=A0AAW2X0G2_9LAMI
MRGIAPASMVGVRVAAGGVEVGYGGYRAPFTAVQWQELEQQAMIYKYLVAGLPVPPDLVMPIRRGFEALSARFGHHPSLGYGSYYGKKFDPEPGRCRRTDGKKWRCSKDAHTDSKYCERHMHRGRNRSRKPVESHSTTQSLSAAISHVSTGCRSNSGSVQGSGTGSFQRMPLYSVVSSGLSSLESNVTKLQTEPVTYGIDAKEFRSIHGLTPAPNDHSPYPGASGCVGSLGLSSSAGSGTWRLMPSQVSSSSSFKLKSDSQVLNHSSAQQSMSRAFQPINAKQQEQHCFFGSDVGLSEPVKQEQHPVHPFFSEWPTTKESWSNLDTDGSNENVFSSTQLSISIPTTSCYFSSRSAYSTNGELGAATRSTLFLQKTTKFWLTKLNLCDWLDRWLKVDRE